MITSLAGTHHDSLQESMSISTTQLIIDDTVKSYGYLCHPSRYRLVCWPHRMECQFQSIVQPSPFLFVSVVDSRDCVDLGMLETADKFHPLASIILPNHREQSWLHGMYYIRLYTNYICYLEVTKNNSMAYIT